MNRFSIYFILLCIFYTVSNYAQTIVYTENFEGTSGRALPAGWLNVSTDTPGWIGCTAATISSNNYSVPSHTRFAAINDDRFNTGLPGHNNINDRLTSPSFSLAGLTLPFLGFDQFFSGQSTETATVQVSTDGGATWVYIDSLYLTGYPSAWQTRQISLQQFVGMTNVKVRFGYSDGGGWGDGSAVDNVQVFQPVDYDVSADKLNLATIILNNTPLSVVVTNHGAQVITSLAMNYSINGGTPFAQTFTGLHIIPYTSDTLTFSSNINSFPIDASYSVTVNATLVNGNADANMNNNQGIKNFLVANHSVQRSVLFEECTSSTCPPCAGFAGYYDPIWQGMGADVPDSNFNIVKYQQDFPAPYDSSYNTYGGQRFGYYNMVGIPTLEIDGSELGTIDVAANKLIPAYLTLTGAYLYKASKDSVYVTITATPHFTAVGSYALRVALTEDHYQNPNNLNGQLDYYDVERDMLPNEIGTPIDTFIDGQSKTFTFKTKVSSGIVHMNSHTFWGSPQNSHMVAFVQDDNTKEVLQSVIAAPSHPASIENLSALNDLQLYPNPAGAAAYLTFYLTVPQVVGITVSDVTGRSVYTISSLLTNGAQKISLPTAALQTGLYNISIQTAGGTETKKLTVIN